MIVHGPSPGEVAHDRALADWLEAEALVAALRRSARAAGERAAERGLAAAMVLRSGRCDAYALGVADAASVLAQRAASEERRLAEAIRSAFRLRERLASAREALDAPQDATSTQDGRRSRCA